MITTSIRHIGCLKVLDEKTGAVCYGCSQEWFKTRWQRISGCGPSVVSNIVRYIKQTRLRVLPEISMPTRKDSLFLMEEVWRHVTPSYRGIPTAEVLCRGIRSYARFKHEGWTTEWIDIPDRPALRPDFIYILAFIEKSLKQDLPVAFLNRDNGAEKRLDAWHWVTLVSLSRPQDGKEAKASIIDDGRLFEIDLALWYRTTTQGGGLVRFGPSF